MSKQEDIREGMFDLIKEADFEETPDEEVWERNLTNKLLAYLHSQGVVIKVDSKLHIMHQDGLKIARLVKDAGYIAYEPLID